MKSLNFKIGLSIVIIFGLLVTGLLVYEPLWWKWQTYRLCSDDAATSDAAAKAIAGKGRKAIPMLHKWLDSKDDEQVIRACRIMVLMDSTE